MRILWLVIVLLLSLASQPASAERKLALIFGNDSYESLPSLKKAVNDATAMRDTLSGIGFQAELTTNANRRGMNQSLAKFEGQIEPGDEVFFFYAGHGVAIAGENYLLPTDMLPPEVGQESLIEDEAISVDRVIRRFQARGAAVSFVVLDACRDNPFAGADGTRSIGQTRGLTRIEPPSGVFVLYSAGLGQTALDRLNDDDPDPNSVFTRKLIPILKTPGLSHVGIAKRVQAEVIETASLVGHRQEPAYYDQIKGEIVLLPGLVPQPEIQTLIAPPPNAAMIGRTQVSLILPDGHCQLDPGEPADARIMSSIRGAIAGTNELVASFAECNELKGWRAGIYPTLNHFGQYMTLLQTLNQEIDVPSSIMIPEVCKEMRAASPAENQAIISKAGNRLEVIMDGIKINEQKLLGVIDEDDYGCYAAIFQRMQAEVGGEKEVAGVFTTTFVKGKFIYINLYAPFGDGIVDKLLAEQKALTKRFVEANR
ncbi:MAG: caspase family protein [Hyphomicrobiaceae bacterium]